VKVEGTILVLGYPSLAACTISVDVKQRWIRTWSHPFNCHAYYRFLTHWHQPHVWFGWRGPPVYSLCLPDTAWHNGTGHDTAWCDMTLHDVTWHAPPLPCPSGRGQYTQSSCGLWRSLEGWGRWSAIFEALKVSERKKRMIILSEDLESFLNSDWTTLLYHKLYAILDYTILSYSILSYPILSYTSLHNSCGCF